MRQARTLLLGLALCGLALLGAGCAGEPAGDAPNPVEDPPQEASASEDPRVARNEVDQPPSSGP